MMHGTMIVINCGGSSVRGQKVHLGSKALKCIHIHVF